MAHFKVNIESNSPYGGDYYNLSTAYENFGELDKAKEVMELCAERIPDSTSPPWTLARIYVKQQEYDLALAEADKYFLLTGDKNSRIKGDIYHFMSDWDEAEKYYLDLLEKNPVSGRNSLASLFLSQGRMERAEFQLKMGIELSDEGNWRRSNFLRRLGYVHLLTGDHEKALEACYEAWENSGKTGPIRMHIQRRALYFKGFALIETGAMEEAGRVQDRLTALIEEGMNKKAVRYSLFLVGMAALHKRNFPKAIDSLAKASALIRPQLYENNYLPCNEHALFYDSLASAYYQTGDLEKAEEWYKKIHALTLGRLYYGDIYAKSFYMLGKIYEQQESKARAIEHYEKFLDLWKDADISISEVEDAKKRVAGLKQ
jgi:tetratricopeptide (TPR) repeat protein